MLDTTDGEVELLRRRQDLELRSDAPEPLSSHPKYSDHIPLDTVVLTTHRLVLQDSDENARFLHLSNIHAVSLEPARVFSSHSKILLSTFSLGDLLLVMSKKEGPAVMSTLEKTLERRAWETASRLSQQQHTAVSKRRVGVDAILAKSKKKHDRAAQLADDAFEGDAETLLREASELVAIIQKYAATLETQNTSTTNKDASQLVDMLQDMGMTSALPQQKGSSSDYYETLARQLADFMRPKLEQAGGVMTLTDVYCLYNRARGTNLISPQDLLSAVACFDYLSLGIRQREFPSGVKVLQSSAFDEEKMAEKLQDMALHGLTELEVSRQLHISALLANEQLLAAERKGYLCRDVTLETTRFYRNRFPEFALQ